MYTENAHRTHIEIRESHIEPPTHPPTDSQSEICSIVYYAIIFIVRQVKIKKQRASPNAADPQTQGPRHIPDEPRLRLTGWQEAGARLGGGCGETGRMGGGWEEAGRGLGRRLGGAGRRLGGGWGGGQKVSKTNGKMKARGSKYAFLSVKWAASIKKPMRILTIWAKKCQKPMVK